MHGIGNDSGQSRGVQHAFVQIEVPAAILLSKKPALQLIGEARNRRRKRLQFLVEERSQSLEFFRTRQLIGADFFVKCARENLVAKRFWIIEDIGVRPPGRRGFFLIERVVVAVLLIGVSCIRHVFGFGYISFRVFVVAGLILPLAALVLGLLGVLRAAFLNVFVFLVFAVVRLVRI